MALYPAALFWMSDGAMRASSSIDELPFLVVISAVSLSGRAATSIPLPLAVLIGMRRRPLIFLSLGAMPFAKLLKSARLVIFDSSFRSMSMTALPESESLTRFPLSDSARRVSFFSFRVTVSRHSLTAERLDISSPLPSEIRPAIANHYSSCQFHLRA